MLRTTFPHPRPRAARLLAAAAGAILVLAAPAAAQQGGAVGETREALEKWVETRRVISAEKRDWELGRELLAERIALLEREIEGLRGRVATARESIAAADERREELLAENETLKASAAGLGELASGFEERTGALLGRVPERVADQVRPLSQRLPGADGAGDRSLSERFQTVVGILNEIDKFHREISVHSEIRQLADGSSIEVSTLYLGLGQAFYVSSNGLVGGTGGAGPEGWTWTPANASAGLISQAIAVYRGEAPAAYVQLPVRLSAPQENQ
jgi:FtsZ-binding cell division protein ZapB